MKLLGHQFTNLHFSAYREAVDLFTKIDLEYQDSFASAKVGIGAKSEGSLVVAGTRGYIYVPAPWWKTDYFELRYENTAETEKNFYKFSGDGLRYEMVEFLHQISEGKMDTEASKVSITIARIIEQFRHEYYGC